MLIWSPRTQEVMWNPSRLFGYMRNLVTKRDLEGIGDSIIR